VALFITRLETEFIITKKTWTDLLNQDELIRMKDDFFGKSRGAAETKKKPPGGEPDGKRR
jgi:hypothetical protein